MALTAQQKQELADVYDQAVSAGDDIAAQRVKDILARDRAETADAFKGKSIGRTLLEFQNPPIASLDVSPGEVADAGMKTSASLGGGTLEGLRRAAGGAKQLAGGVVDTFTRNHIAGRGKKQLWTEQELLRQK